jgi:hypothetical protein
MRNLLLLFFLCFSAHLALAQIAPGEKMPDTLTVRNAGWDLYFTEEFTFASRFDQMNRLIVPAGYDPMGGVLLMLGGGVAYRLNRCRFGYEISHTFNPGLNSLIWDVPVRIRRTAYQQFFFSFDAYTGMKRRFTPYVGFGAYFTRLQLLRLIEKDTDVESLLQNPGNAIVMDHFQETFNLGVSLATASDRRKNAGFVAMRIGYRFGRANPWYSSHANLINAPVDHMNNVYLNVNFGASFNRHRRPWRFF